MITMTAKAVSVQGQDISKFIRKYAVPQMHPSTLNMAMYALVYLKEQTVGMPSLTRQLPQSAPVDDVSTANALLNVLAAASGSLESSAVELDGLFCAIHWSMVE